MISKEAFIEKFGKTREEIDSCEISWEDLTKIYEDYEQRHSDLLAAGNMIAANLQQIDKVHSVRMRVKNPEHLIEKIIRKKNENLEREITLENYFENITDLIGVRALHLFKDDWIPIHEAIQEKWNLAETPTANIREGDPKNVFEDRECLVFAHKHGYRSVHYLIKSSPTKEQIVAEIQIRTIFEEGWSEIDHELRYPYETDNIILSYNLAILNRLAGSADETATFVKLIKEEVKKYQDEIEENKIKNEEAIAEIESLRENIDIEDEKDQKIQNAIDTIKKSTSTPSNNIFSNTAFQELATKMFCNKCGGIKVSGLCPQCAINAMTCNKCGGIKINGVCSQCMLTAMTCNKCGGIKVNGVCPQCMITATSCNKCGGIKVRGVCPQCTMRRLG